MKMEYMICTFVFILVIVVIIITLTKNKKGPFTNKENFKREGFVETTPVSSTKTLKYFGGGYCPFSNINSNAYNVIKEFEGLKHDVKVEYYWTEDNQSDMEKYKIMYVPTILGKNDQPIELKLPDDYSKTDKSDAQLKEALMNHLYTLL
jgi:hypothetical protein